VTRSRNEELQRGSTLTLVLVLAMALAFSMVFLLEQGQVQARAGRFRLESVRALYLAYGELAKATAIIGRAGYDLSGRNLALTAAMEDPERKIAGTDVVIEKLTGPEGTWYSMTATVPFEDSERVVRQAVREVDYFSSYNLFVDRDPVGISGTPIGAIHSNRSVQFYFPRGFYRDPVTAVEGFTYKGGATPENTTLAGASNPAAQHIDIESLHSDRFNLNSIEANADPAFKFDETVDVALKLYIKNGEQWVQIEQWTQPRIDLVDELVIVGYNEVNPREETYTYTEKVSLGFVEKTREVQVFDHYETVLEEYQEPVYVSDTRDVQVPVYRDETRIRQKEVYRTETRTRTVIKKVWVSLDSSDGTTVGGDGTGSGGYWVDMEVEETYTVQVFDHYEDEEYTVKVLDHYDTVTETYQRLDHYETRTREKQQAVYRTETETYQEEVFEDVLRTGTRIVTDQEPIYETRQTTVYVKSVKISTKDSRLADNGLIYAGGDVRSIKGDVIGRVTVASRGSILITGDLTYKDAAGNTAFLNGKDPGKPYEPNPEYEARAALGLVAQNDVLYTRAIPDNTELNASMLAVSGRVGIEGIILDDNGEVAAYNQFTDEFGRPVKGTLKKNSIRRLGGVTSARRPVETVVQSGAVVSGFNVGKAIFDKNLLEAPPPFFLSLQVPRFFATTLVK
jgi:hypothetical protein